MGTATTFDVVSAGGDLIGVAIAPGLGTAASASSGKAAQLGRVALEAPPSSIGRNTIHAMQSGLVFGYVGLVEGMVERIKSDWEEDRALVIGTGGLISIIQNHTEIFDRVEPWLTLEGLLAIRKLNRQDSRG